MENNKGFMNIKNKFRDWVASFTTFDLVLMALLAVANGIVSSPLAHLNLQLTAIGGPMATSLTVGIYIIYGILAMYIIRKRGTALITFMIGAIVQSLFGIGYGVISAFAAAICYAIAVEALFAMTRYKFWGYGIMVMASLGATVVWFPVAAYLFGYYKWDLSVLMVTLLIRCLSGILLCGVISKLLGDGLAAAKLLRPYAVSQAHKQSSR